MKRSRIAVVVASVLACPVAGRVQAAFSEFVRITPETEEKHGVYVQILPVEGQSDRYKVVPPKIGYWMSSYLIVCKDKVPAERQNFREEIWSSRSDRTDILSVIPLLPAGTYDGPRLRLTDAPIPCEIILDRSLLEKSYVYIDFPNVVADGGYYYCIDLSTYRLLEDRRMTVQYSPVQGLGPQEGVMRRDPSDIIKVGDSYYVWYTRGKVAHGYDATVWYATSHDGHTWTEKGEALPRGPEGGWDAQSVFTPNILVAEGKYWLFYTGVPKPFNNKGNRVTKSVIGLAVAKSPDGPWKKMFANPVLRCSDGREFDSMRVDDACLIVREGKYWLYYKGRQWGNTPANTKTGVAVAERPEGPYEKYVANPVIKGGHEVLVWPLGDGVAAMVNIGPEGIRRTLQYAADGLRFSKMMDLEDVPSAPGAYRPEAFTDSGKGRMIEWGVHIGRKEGVLPFIERFDCQWGAR